MNLEELKRMKMSELTKLAKKYNITGVGGVKKTGTYFCPSPGSH